MVMIATLSFLSSLSLMLLIGAASYISRGAIRRGLVILVAAAGLAGTSALEIYPALRLTEGTSDDAFRLAEIELLRSDRDRLVAEVNQKARDNEALSKTSAFFSKLHKERLTRIAEELRTTKDLILGPASGLVAAPDTADVMLTSFVEGPGGFDSILADIRRLKSLRARGADEPVAPILAMVSPQRGTDAGTTGMIVDMPSGPAKGEPASQRELDEKMAAENDTLAAMRKALDSKMATTGYKVEPIGEPEFVAGRPGRYYLIELKGQKSGQRFTFDSGKYTFQSSRNDYKASFNTFASDVLRQLEGQTKFDLFVRGSADAQAYSGQLEPGFEYRKISYLPSARGKYLGNLATVAVNSAVRNSDLPNLRGEYLRGFLSELYPTKPAIILEGNVTKKDNPAARYTELILFVAW
jgi:hypothetical protein